MCNMIRRRSDGLSARSSVVVYYEPFKQLTLAMHQHSKDGQFVCKVIVLFLLIGASHTILTSRS